MKAFQRIIWGAVLLFWLGTPGCRKCETQDDETAIRQLIDGAVKSAEAQDIGALMDIATEDLTVLPGNKDRQKVKRELFVAFRYYGTFSIKHPRPTVNVDRTGEFAEAFVPFLILKAGVDPPDLSGLYEDPEAFVQEVSKLADLYRLELWLKKDGGDWLVRKARIQGGVRLMPRF